jgi:hypothetical protein
VRKSCQGVLHERPNVAVGKPVPRAPTNVRPDLAPILAELRAAGITSKKGIAEALNARGIPTAGGSGRWYHRKWGGCWRGCRPNEDQCERRRMGDAGDTGPPGA